MAQRLPIITALFFSIIFATNAALADNHDAFYRGKTVRIVVGAPAGGGFDIYSRALARHLGKHIAGNPTLIVENMAGAGTLVAANFTYKAAKPDGLTIGNFIGGLIVGVANGASRD